MATWLNIVRKQRAIIDVPLFLVFLGAAIVFALRSDGVDYRTYATSFVNSVSNQSIIVDWGYQGLELALASLGLPFKSIMLILVVLQFLSISRLARLFELEYLALIALFFIHLYVVRDLSQLRVALGVYIVFLAIERQWIVRVGLYAIGISMQASIIVLVLAYEFTGNVRKKARYLSYVVAIPFAIIGAGDFIHLISFIDPRIEIYINWETEGYGLPVTSYAQFAFHFLVFLVGLLAYKKLDNKRMSRLIELQLIGLLIFIFFRDFAIFSFRLANIATSFYPLILLAIVTKDSLRGKPLIPPIAFSKSDFARMLALSLILMAGFRGVTSTIISDVTL